MNLRSQRFLQIVAVLTACMFLFACTSVQQVRSSDIGRLAALVQPGDTVNCIMRDGSTVVVKVSSVETDTLVSSSGCRIAVADIAGAEIKRTDSTKSVLLGVAIAVGVAAAVAIGCHGGGGGNGGGGGY